MTLKGGIVFRQFRLKKRMTHPLRMSLLDTEGHYCFYDGHFKLEWPTIPLPVWMLSQDYPLAWVSKRYLGSQITS